MKFLRNFLAAFTALVVFSSIGFIILVGIIAVVGAEDEIIHKR